MSDLGKLRLCGGPQDGRQVVDCDLRPRSTLVMPRITDEGLMVQDYYLIADDGGTLVGNFERTEAVPEPPVWPDKPGDQAPALDPELVPYLDWPAGWEENEVWCSKPGCTIGDCGNSNPESRAWICSRYHLNARELLVGIKKHAEGEQAGDE